MQNVLFDPKLIIIIGSCLSHRNTTPWSATVAGAGLNKPARDSVGRMLEKKGQIAAFSHRSRTDLIVKHRSKPSKSRGRGKKKKTAE